MNQSLHSRVKLAVSWVDSSRWKTSKTTKDANISRQGFSLRILRYASYFVHRLPWERRNHQSQISYSFNGAFEGRKLPKTATNEEEKRALYQDNASCHKSIATMAKLHELHFEFLLHPPYSPELAHSDYWLFADFKRMLQENRFRSNEVISEAEVYFEAKEKSFYKKGHGIVRKALESVYHPRRRLCWWIKLLFYYLGSGLIEWCVIYNL